MGRYVDIDKVKWNKHYLAISNGTVVRETLQVDADYLNTLVEDVAPIVHAHWICKSVDDNDNGEYTCSRCGYGEEHSINCEVPYCWRCGAKMDGVIYNE